MSPDLVKPLDHLISIITCYRISLDIARPIVTPCSGAPRGALEEVIHLEDVIPFQKETHHQETISVMDLLPGDTQDFHLLVFQEGMEEAQEKIGGTLEEEFGQEPVCMFILFQCSSVLLGSLLFSAIPFNYFQVLSVTFIFFHFLKFLSVPFWERAREGLGEVGDNEARAN